MEVGVTLVALSGRWSVAVPVSTPATNKRHASSVIVRQYYNFMFLYMNLTCSRDQLTILGGYVLWLSGV